MRTRCIVLAGFLIIALAGSAFAGPDKAYQVRDDYGSEPLSDCFLNYYYYIPCPTYSWFWGYNGFAEGDIVGAWFQIGDPSMSGSAVCDPATCFTLERLRFIEFTGYGNYPRYPGLLDVDYDIYCADEYGCPIGPALWHNSTIRTTAGWTYIDFAPPLSLCGCAAQPSSAPRILFTVTHYGRACDYLDWGCDNISTAVAEACNMHDYGCLPVLYPRPYNSHYGTMHSGYYGNGSFQYCPPQWFKDGRDSTPDGSLYGFVEWAVRLYMSCTGPSRTESVSWGAIKSMYR